MLAFRRRSVLSEYFEFISLIAASDKTYSLLGKTTNISLNTCIGLIVTVFTVVLTQRIYDNSCTVIVMKLSSGRWRHWRSQAFVLGGLLLLLLLLLLMTLGIFQGHWTSSIRTWGYGLRSNLRTLI